jgi:hypothetical protein
MLLKCQKAAVRRKLRDRNPDLFSAFEIFDHAGCLLGCPAETQGLGFLQVLGKTDRCFGNGCRYVQSTSGVPGSEPGAGVARRRGLDRLRSRTLRRLGPRPRPYLPCGLLRGWAYAQHGHARRAAIHPMPSWVLPFLGHTTISAPQEISICAAVAGVLPDHLPRSRCRQIATDVHRKSREGSDSRSGTRPRSFRRGGGPSQHRLGVHKPSSRRARL